MHTFVQEITSLAIFLAAMILGFATLVILVVLAVAIGPWWAKVIVVVLTSNLVVLAKDYQAI